MKKRSSIGARPAKIDSYTRWRKSKAFAAQCSLLTPGSFSLFDKRLESDYSKDGGPAPIYQPVYPDLVNTAREYKNSQFLGVTSTTEGF